MVVANQSVTASTDSSPVYLVKQSIIKKFNQHPVFTAYNLKRNPSKHLSSLIRNKLQNLNKTSARKQGISKNFYQYKVPLITYLYRQWELLQPGRKAKMLGRPVDARRRSKRENRSRTRV